MDVLRVGVADDICNCFLRNPEAGGFNVARKPPHNSVGTEMAGKPRALSNPIKIPAQRDNKSQIIQYGGPEVEGKITNLHDQPVDQLDTLTHQIPGGPGIRAALYRLNVNLES